MSVVTVEQTPAQVIARKTVAMTVVRHGADAKGCDCEGGQEGLNAAAINVAHRRGLVHHPV